MNKKNKFSKLAPKDKKKKETKDEGSKPPVRRARISGKARVGIWIFAFASLGALCFAILTLFSGAKIDIYPKIEQVSLDNKFTGYYKSSDSGDIKYEIMETSLEDEKVVEAEEVKKVEERASGNVIIFNDYKTSSQKLISGTRFKASNGLIYKIDEAVWVPGQHTENGQQVPGRLEVEIKAAEPGEKYNLSEGEEFTVPGLKGTELHEGYYAKSSTKISGGVSEMRPVLSSEKKKRVIEEWKEKLKNDLKEKALSQIPDDFYFFENAVDVKTEITSVDQIGENQAELKARTTFTGVLLPEDKLAQMIAREKSDFYEGGEIEIRGVNDMELTVEDPESFDPAKKGVFDFNLKGSGKLVWQIDTESVKKGLMGKPKSSLDDILSDYNGVAKAEASIRPFWASEFPLNDKDIDVRIREK